MRYSGGAVEIERHMATQCLHARKKRCVSAGRLAHAPGANVVSSTCKAGGTDYKKDYWKWKLVWMSDRLGRKPYFLT